MSPGVIASIGLGANLGDAVGTLADAVDALGDIPGTRLLRASRRYRTPAWGLREQPDFINAVALVETTLAPHDLLEALLAIEHRHGRTRAIDGSDRWGPRTLDLDILLYGDAVVDRHGLRIPHPRLHERAFALVPLLELLPDAVIPGIGPARIALQSLQTDNIEALG